MKQQNFFLSLRKGVLLGLLPLMLLAQRRITKAARPEWVDKITPGMYVGVSHRFPAEADARADALASAKRQIIETLGGVIESEFVDEIVEATDEITATDAFTRSRIKVVSRNIIAVKPTKVFIEKWKQRHGLRSEILYQAFVAVPFSETQHRQFMHELVQESVSLGKDQHEQSLQLAYQGQLFNALDQLHQIVDNVSPMSDITGLSPQDLNTMQAFKEQVEAKISALRGSIRTAGQGDQQIAKLGKELEQPLTLRVFWIENQKTYPLPGLPVKFRLLEGKARFQPQSKTDRDGVAVCRVQEIASAGDITLEALVNFPNDYGIEDQTYRFHIFSDNKVAIKVLETNLDQPVTVSYLENQLLQKLTGKGFSLIEQDIFGQLSAAQALQSNPVQITEQFQDANLDLIVIGQISAGQVNQIQEGFYFSRARGILKVFDLAQQAVIGNYILEDKNAGNSPENAGSKAIRKVSDALIEKFLTDIGLQQ